ADSHREKGEFVVLIEAAHEAAAEDNLEAKRVLTILLKECSLKQAAALAAQLTGQKKNALYQLALEMKEENQDQSE
ncbi:MAG: rRNA (cytidine-2'-O-)-methyltransferase, partial [Burkholderiales bacterium]|nr:rRNA (cytidine-2'-O-)-methyltransferase [Burkholderiales bacterium]